jgi:ribosomal protein L40E
MIVCPNCSHENPIGATNCEACYTALPETKACVNCGASVQPDATFCGQCGHSFQSVTIPPSSSSIPAPTATTEAVGSGLPPTILTINSDPDPATIETQLPGMVTPTIEPLPAIPDPDLPNFGTEVPVTPVPVEPGIPSVPTVISPVATQLQQSLYHLLHLQTNTPSEISPHALVVYLGKPNDRSPPDIDVSGFPCSEVVSRVHASILVEGDNYYIEDLGSANGTYINHNTLIKGNRHLLKVGDRISLGKGDLVTFIFQSGLPQSPM